MIITDWIELAAKWEVIGIIFAISLVSIIILAFIIIGLIVAFEGR